MRTLLFSVRLSVVVAIIWEHFFELAVVGKLHFVSTVTTILIIAALRTRYGHYIFVLWFLLSFFFFLLFFLALSQPPHIGCLPYSYTWCGLSANLECRSEMCCTLLAANTGRKKVAKNRHLGTIAQLRRAISSQVRHVSPPHVPVIWWTSVH